MNISKKQELIAHYRNQLSDVLSGKPWIAAMDVLVSAAKYAKTLQDLGAESVLAIGASRGTGNIPDNIDCIDLKLKSADCMLRSIHQSDAALSKVPAWVQAKVDSFDPTGHAKVIGSQISSGAPVAGRPILGARPLSWQAIEDKMIIDEFWDAAGIRRAPSRILNLRDEEIFEVSEQMDLGHGSIWTGDNLEGWHGGASLIRRVRTHEQAQMARKFLSKSCERVRIMPFLEGLPCSIHAWVFPEEIISFRPCEMLVFQTPNSDKFLYAGSSTVWEPPSDVAESMRAAVVKAGERLRKTVDYRGVFTMDGIHTSQGFLPTELNPRFGGAMFRMAASLSDLPLYLLNCCCMEGIDLDWRPLELQQLVCGAVAESPVLKGMYPIEGKTGLGTRKLHFSGTIENGWKVVPEGTEGSGTLTLGQAGFGGILFAEFAKSQIEPGPSGAPLVSSVFEFAEKVWGLGLEPLKPSREFRQ